MNAVAKELYRLCYQGITVQIRIYDKYSETFEVTMTYKCYHTRHLVHAEMFSTDERVVQFLKYMESTLIDYCRIKDNENK